MTQRTSHIYRLVTLPAFYAGFQNALGADRARRTFIKEFLEPLSPNAKVLDVGCGPATLLGYLDDIQYTGLDLNEKHIAQAREAYGNRGQFLCGNAVSDLPAGEGQFDVVICSGLLHHLTDADARSLLRHLSQHIRPGGRICTFDQVWLPKQRRIAALLNALDSGKNVRTPAGYLALTEGIDLDVSHKMYHNLLRVPYDHFVMRLERPTLPAHEPARM